MGGYELDRGFASLATLLMLAPLALGTFATAQETDAVVIPSLREGDRVLYEYVFWMPNGSQSETFRAEWRWATGPLDVEDAYGKARRAYLLEPVCGGGACTSRFSHTVDATTGDLLEWAERWERQGGYRLVEGIELTLHPSHSWGTVRYAQHHIVPMLALHGRSLLSGDEVRHGAPALSSQPGASLEDVVYLARGWEDVGGARLFRVDVETPERSTFGGFPASLWFDGETPLPVRWTRGFPDDVVAEWRLTSFERGAGEALFDPAYAPGRWLEKHQDATFVPYTVDGPAEAPPTRLALADAIAVARADPRVASWLAAHPDAIVVAGEYEDSVPRWTLTWGNASRELDVTVRGASVPGAPPLGVTTVFETIVRRTLPAPEVLAQTDVACLERATALAQTEAGLPPDAAPARLEFGLRAITGGVSLDCLAIGSRPDGAYGFDGEGESAYATVRVHGVTGAFHRASTQSIVHDGIVAA